jgi:predicted DNA-binding protein (UPF0278 family)
VIPTRVYKNLLENVKNFLESVSWQTKKMENYVSQKTPNTWKKKCPITMPKTKFQVSPKNPNDQN